MTTNRRLPGICILAVSLALLLFASFALGTQASALTIADSGSDAVTSVTPNAEGAVPPAFGGQLPPQMPDGAQPQTPDGSEQSFPMRPDGAQPRFFTEDGSEAEPSLGGRPQMQGEPGARGFLTMEDASGPHGADAKGGQLHPVVWSLIGFGAALVLGSAALGVVALVKRRKAAQATAPVVETE